MGQRPMKTPRSRAVRPCAPHCSRCGAGCLFGARPSHRRIRTKPSRFCATARLRLAKSRKTSVWFNSGAGSARLVRSSSPSPRRLRPAGFSPPFGRAPPLRLRGFPVPSALAPPCPPVRGRRAGARSAPAPGVASRAQAPPCPLYAKDAWGRAPPLRGGNGGRGGRLRALRGAPKRTWKA